MGNEKITIKGARNMREITQDEMAKELGIAKSTYRNYEEGKREMPLAKAFRFAEIVGLSVYQINFFNEKFFLAKK